MMGIAFLLSRRRKDRLEVEDISRSCGEESLANIKRALGQYIRHGGYRRVYIGRTSDIYARKRQHERHSRGLKRMLIVCKSNSVDDARFVEVQLIEHFTKRADLSVLNRSDDSRGNVGDPPHYVYVLLG